MWVRLLAVDPNDTEVLMRHPFCIIQGITTMAKLGMDELSQMLLMLPYRKP